MSKKKTKVENDTELLENDAVDTKKKGKKAKKAKKEKTPMDVATKNTLVKSITAVVCVIAICITAVSGTGTICDAIKKAAEQKGSAVSDTMGDDLSGGDDSYVDDSVAGDDASAGGDETSAEDVTTSEDEPASQEDASSSASGSASSNSTTPSKNNSSSASSSIPTGTAQILNYYNTATAKVASKKAPFSKTRSTTEKSYDAGIALKTFKGLVYKFMGVGDDNKFTKSVTSADADSYQKYFQASKLTANDVTSASCTKSGSNYTITIKLKNGTSTVTGGKVVSSNNTPLDRSGLACGEHDKDYWDHKTAENVNSAIQDIATSANINESYSNAVITAVVNASNGNLVSLKVSFDFKFELSKVMGASATAQASSVVNMTGFKF